MGLALAATTATIEWFPEGISSGNVLTILVLLVTFTATVVTMKNAIQSNRELVGIRLDNHEQLLAKMSEEMSKLADIITHQAVAEQRMLAEGKRLDEVERRLNDIDREHRRLRQ